MITFKQAFKVSAIIDKLDLKITNPKGSQEEVGSDLMLQVAAKAHKAENEIIALVMEVKRCTKEEAEKTELDQFFASLMGSDLVTFFKSAVKSKAQG